MIALPIIALILHFALDALRDSFVEAYKNRLMDNKGIDPPARYWGYSPTRKGLFGRDAFHDSKWISGLALCFVLAEALKDLVPHYYCGFGAGLIAWALFNPFLWLFRKGRR